MDGKISEQRVYCKIRAQLGFPPTEIHADFQKVYGNGALKYATVCKWVRRFNVCRESIESIENDPQVGRLVSVLTEKNVATVKTLIEEDACYTMQEIEELSGIHLSRVFLNILRKRLGLCKICARWVPHLLTDVQKQSRVKLASQIIEKYDRCDPHRLEEIVTGDENGYGKVVLSLESFTEKVFLLNLLISIRNADLAPVSATSNYSITHWPINLLRYRNI
jgi:histone-lysine N-methyltransferase SETMAR